MRELALLFEAPVAMETANRTSGRLLTLTGGAGHGKTRLAVEVARCFNVASEGTVVLVPLATIRAPRRLLDALGGALSLPPLDGDFAWQRVIQALRARPTLLILDNFEHLIEGGSPLVKKLLHEAPQVVCLVTSQHHLGLAGEREIRVTGLSIPAVFETDVNELSSNASVQLFLDRARLMRPDLQLNAVNAVAMGALCRALEGVPLAIELTAARASSLSPAQMLEALEERLKFLRLRAGSEGAIDPRHHSARAALSWSFQLLPPDLARLLPELSLFRGGWNLQSARTICHAPPSNAPFWWPEAHERLLEYSLIKPSENGVAPDGEPRFELSETVRQFAAEKLPQKSLRALERRHARYFLELFEEATRARQHSEWSQWLPILARENANLRAAMEWTLHHDKALALRLAAAAWWFWFLSGMLDEGRDWLARALEALEETAPATFPACYASALCGAGFMAWRQGDIANAVRLSTQSLAMSRASGDRSGIIYSLIPLQLAQLIQCNYEEALASSDECGALCRELNDQYGLAFSLHLAGGIHCEMGDTERAWSLQQQSHALFEVVGSREGMAYALFNRGTAERRRGDWEAAVQSCQQSRQIFEELHHPEGVAHARLQGGLALVYGQQFARAHPLLLEAMDGFERMNLRWAIVLTLEALAMGAQQNAGASAGADANNITPWATQLWSAAQHARAQMGTPIPPADRAVFAAFEADLRASIDAPAFEAAWQIGRLLKLEQVAKRARQFPLVAG